MSDPTVRRHPVRGGLGGLCAGIGATLLLVSYAKAPFGQATAWVPIVILVVVGVLIGLFAPPLGGSAPTESGPPPPQPTAPTVPDTAPDEPTT